MHPTIELMQKAAHYVICLISSPANVSEAIAEAIVREKLGACAQIVSPITSFYRWEGNIQKDPEALILVKTERGAIRGLKDLVSKMHPYTIPEFVVFPMIDGLDSYFAWIHDAVSTKK